jgi:hypothetical protein
LRLCFKNKKGSILDGIYLIALVLVFFLFFTVAKLIWDGATESGTLVGNVSEAQDVVDRYDDRIVPMFDAFFVFAIIGGFIAVFILAYFISGTPVFMPIMVMVMTIAIALAVFVSNAHDTIITSSPTIATTVAQWTMTEYLIENLPAITLFLFVGLIVVMLAFGVGGQSEYR